MGDFPAESKSPPALSQAAALCADFPTGMVSSIVGQIVCRKIGSHGRRQIAMALSRRDMPIEGGLARICSDSEPL